MAVDNNQNRSFVKSRFGIDTGGESGFETAQKILESSVDYYNMDLFDLQSLGRKFDLVLFMGIFYHLKDPFKALEIISSITSGAMILESHYIDKYGNEPIMEFYSTDNLNQDPTCWWGPNIPCLRKMIFSAGYQNIDVELPYKSFGKERILFRALK